jgi:hypothetical protein
MLSKSSSSAISISVDIIIIYSTCPARISFWFGEVKYNVVALVVKRRWVKVRSET